MSIRNSIDNLSTRNGNRKINPPISQSFALSAPISLRYGYSGSNLRHFGSRGRSVAARLRLRGLLNVQGGQDHGADDGQSAPREAVSN